MRKMILSGNDLSVGIFYIIFVIFPYYLYGSRHVELIL